MFHNVVVQCFYFVILLQILSVLVAVVSGKYVETIPDAGGLVEGCAERPLKFGCQEEGTVIAITEAWLHYAWHKVPRRKCHIAAYNVQFKKGSVLNYINKVCSLKKDCDFNTWRDIPGANDNEKHWKGSVIRLNYECIQESSIMDACDKRLKVQEGWIHNTRYPDYYLGSIGGVCSYTIAVDEGQKIKMRIVDLSLREVLRPTETECKDSLAVTEGSRTLLQPTCGDWNKPISIISESNVVHITLRATEEMFPKRGFLAHFTALGCQTPAIPENGYLSHRNSTHAVFWCNVGFVFEDSYSRTQVLFCKNHIEWNAQLQECADLDDLLLNGTITEQQYRRYNESIKASKFVMEEEIVFDIIVPTVLISCLVIGNVGILAIIMTRRRRAKRNFVGLEEYEAIKTSAEPTDILEYTPSDV